MTRRACLAAIAALLALAAGAQQLPALRTPVLEPSLMPPRQDIMDWGDHSDDESVWTPFPASLAWRTSEPITQATFLAWTRLDDASAFSLLHPFIAPNEAFGRAVGVTFLGPESGSGNKTWPGVCQCPLDIGGGIAFNLTCSASATVTAGPTASAPPGSTLTFEPGTHLGEMLYADTGDDLTIETEGTWIIEAATPKAVRCYVPNFAGLNLNRYPANVFADTWGLSVLTLSVAAGEIAFSAKTYYPDGCIEPQSECAATSALDAGLSAIPPATFSPFLMFFSQSIKVDTEAKRAVSVYRAWGPKGFRRILSDAEIQTIIARDAAEMVRRGYLSEADLHPEGDTHSPTGSVQTLSLRAAPAKAAAKGHTHSPGPAPQLPPFMLQEAE